MVDIIDYLNRNGFEACKTKGSKYVRVKDLIGVDKLIATQEDAIHFVKTRSMSSWGFARESKALDKVEGSYE